MTKGTTSVLVIGGVLVVAVGGVIAYLSAKSSAMALPPYRGAPPPPPPTLSGDIHTIGSALINEGGRALSQLGHNEGVTAVTGGEKASSYVVKNVATGGLYSVYKGGTSLLGKLF